MSGIHLAYLTHNKQTHQIHLSLSISSMVQSSDTNTKQLFTSPILRRLSVIHESSTPSKRQKPSRSTKEANNRLSFSERILMDFEAQTVQDLTDMTECLKLVT